jgi:hypothetical protein
MFRSKVRPIVIPQYEHGRLAGTLAQHWGNDDFDRPAMNFTSFFNGVALHDWHYGFADDLPINGADEADWIAMTRRGLTLRLDDPVSDIVAKLHLRRLCSYNPTSERVALMAEFDEVVATRLPETEHSRAKFDWADKITQLCDNVAFHFSFEVERELVANVCARVGGEAETAVSYHILPNGQILMDPWPFAVPSIPGSILGFHADGYPERLQPIVVPFHMYGLAKASKS